jgi:uncharacterized membrane protein
LLGYYEQEEPSSLANPGALVASAHIGVIFARQPSQVAVLNSRRLLQYVTVRSMPKRLLALGVVLVCANTTVISQTVAKPAIYMTPVEERPLNRMTVFGPAA